MAACSDAVDNRTYLLDENENACTGSFMLDLLMLY